MVVMCIWKIERIRPLPMNYSQPSLINLSHGMKGIVAADVYQTMSSSSLSAFMINSEASCSSIPIVNIFYANGSHHSLEIFLIPWWVLAYVYHLISLVYLK
jgi:hypothetical protein